MVNLLKTLSTLLLMLEFIQQKNQEQKELILKSKKDPVLRPKFSHLYPYLCAQ